MALAGNIMDNNALAALSKQAGPRVTKAIKVASADTGVDFAYLMEQARAESSFKTDAQASTSSASGLYQFIESTWISMVKNYGEKHGMGDIAAKIDNNGKVADKQTRADILELRKDPEKAAILAAEFAAENKRYLERNFDGNIGSTELYFAHFMGAGGGSAFLNAHKENPLQNAADLFPKAAKANRNVFYDRQTGEPRTLAAVYDFFDKKFSDNSESNTQIADRANTSKQAPQSPLFNKSHDLFTSMQISNMQNPLNDRAVRAFITHPSLEFLAPELASGWKPKAALPPSLLLSDPIELMILSHFDLPVSRNKQKNL